MATRKLTPKQERFVAEYLIDENATQAAQRAGYSPKSAYAQGHRLLKDAEIQKAITEARKSRSERTEINQDYVLQQLKVEAEGKGENTSPSARVKALELLGKHVGLWGDKDVEDMRRELAEIRQQLRDQGTDLDNGEGGIQTVPPVEPVWGGGVTAR